MAQMVAKAMAKNPTGANKAELDRLAAEFRDELDALGVRVAELEKYADKVVWTGELRYRYWNDREKLLGGGKNREKKNQLQLRLFPTAEVNDHWKLKARLTASANMKDDTTSNFKLTYAFAEGVYDKFTFRVGKMPFFTNVDNGMVMDDFFSGFQAVYGDKFKVALMAGRWNLDNANLMIDDDLDLGSDRIALVTLDSLGEKKIDALLQEMRMAMKAEGNLNSVDGKLKLSVKNGQYNDMVNEKLQQSKKDLLTLEVPFHYRNDLSQRITLEESRLKIDEYALTLQGGARLDTLMLNAKVTTDGAWPVAPLLELLPMQVLPKTQIEQQ